MSPKLNKNRYKLTLNYHIFFDWFVDRFWAVFGANLAQLGPPNRSKIDNKWYQNWLHFLIDLLMRFWLIFVQCWSLWNLQNWALAYTRAQFSLFWCVGLGITFSSILEWFWRPSWGQVGTKISKKSIKKSIKKLMRSWSQFSSIFGRFWGPSWGQVGTKIWPNGVPRGHQKISSKPVTQHAAGRSE